MKAFSLIVVMTALLSVSGCEKSAPAAGEHNEEHHEEAETKVDHVAIDANTARNAGIAVSTAGPAALKETLTLYGVVQPNAERVRTVVARFPGVVKSVNTSLGDRVNAGDVLATIESNDSLQSYPVKAPIAGVITTRTINAGETVAEQALFTVTDLGTVWVELSLFPRERAQIRVGQSVIVRGVQGDASASGHIKWLSAVGNTLTQSFAARVELDNPQNLWTPGLYVTGDVTLGEQAVPVAVQSTALQNLDGKTVVFAETKDGFNVRPVKIGRSDDALTEVLEGIAANERYVSANSFLIKADIEKSSAEDDD